jgi:hypothetical protein
MARAAALASAARLSARTAAGVTLRALTTVQCTVRRQVMKIDKICDQNQASEGP